MTMLVSPRAHLREWNGHGAYAAPPPIITGAYYRRYPARCGAFFDGAALELSDSKVSKSDEDSSSYYK